MQYLNSVLAPPDGVLADRFTRKPILLAGDFRMGHLVSVVTIMRLSKHDFRAEFDRLHPHTESLLRSSMDRAGPANLHRAISGVSA